MTRNDLNRLIKSAAKKRTAFDTAKLTAALSNLAKPTGTGIAAGAGLGTILAAAGALSRSGEDPSNTSILSNPLLLGALGATGGYLAGNAFEQTPTVHDNNDISIPALAALVGGAGTLGTLTAKEQAKYELNDAEKAFNRFLKQKINGPGGSTLNLVHIRKDPVKVDGSDRLVKRYSINRAGNLSDEARLNYEQLLHNKRTDFSKALRRNNNFIRAITDAEYTRPDNVALRMLERVRNSSYSPYRWLTAPLKGGKNTLKVLRGVATRHKVPAALGGLALLAGGGKAIYDKVHD